MRRLILSEDTRGWWYTVLALAVASLVFTLAAPAWAAPGGKNTQIEGVGVPGGPGDNGCVAPPVANPSYTIAMRGDLMGCIYGYELEAKVLDNGILQTRDRELFVGEWDGKKGTWEMREHFTSKWDPTFTEQKYGRCQHPIVDGSGTDDFDGITGRIDFKDDVVLGVANYRGHLKLEILKPSLGGAPAVWPGPVVVHRSVSPL